MAGQAHPYNADLSKESEHAAEFQIHVHHSREEKTGHCHGGFLSGSYCKEIKELFTLAWPTVLSYFFYHMIHMISLFFAGRIGKLELAAGTLALSFINVTGPSLFIGLGSAVETLCSQAFGARNYHLVGVVLQRGVWILGLTCILAWSLWVNSELLLLLVHQEKNVARYVLSKETAYTWLTLPQISVSQMVAAILKSVSIKKKEVSNPGLNLDLLYLISLPCHYATTPTRQNSIKF